MKKIIAIVLLLVNVTAAQEIRRPSTNAASSAATIGCTGTNVVGTVTSPGNWYDAGTPPTATSGTVAATAPSSVLSPRWSGQLLSGWATASGGYSALTININMSCGSSPYAGYDSCSAVYSLNSGSTWSNLAAEISDTTQATYTVSIAPGTVLSSVQVMFCSQANYDTSDASPITTTVGVWDVWTSGTLAGSIQQSGVQMIGLLIWPGNTESGAFV